MADSKQMKLKIEYDNINTAEKPIKSLVNFFTNNSTLRMLKRDSSDPTEITDSKSFEVIIDDDSIEPSDNDKIQLYLGEEYKGFNGTCKLTDPKFIEESGDDPMPESGDESEQEVSVEFYEITDLHVENGICYIPSETLNELLANYGKSDYTDMVSVKIQLTHKIETKWTANIINDGQLDYGRIGIASIKYEDKSEGSDDSALVQDQGINPVIYCDTKFVKVNTALKFYYMSPVEEVSEGAEFSPANVEPIEMDGIPVTITPYYNGKENTDEDIIPNFADDVQDTTEDDRIIQNYKLNKDLTVDWKLRTTTFTLQSESASYDVFYKVGFCPADRKESTEKEVINALKVYTFTVNSDKFTLEYPEWAAYKFDFNKWQQWQQYYITGKPTWFPVYKHEYDSEDATFIGIMYIELYNSEDGTKFTDDIKEFSVMINHDNDCNYFYAPLKDYMLDKGNIPSVYNEVPS